MPREKRCLCQRAGMQPCHRIATLVIIKPIHAISPVLGTELDPYFQCLLLSTELCCPLPVQPQAAVPGQGSALQEQQHSVVGGEVPRAPNSSCTSGSQRWFANMNAHDWLCCLPAAHLGKFQVLQSLEVCRIPIETLCNVNFRQDAMAVHHVTFLMS